MQGINASRAFGKTIGVNTKLYSGLAKRTRSTSGYAQEGNKRKMKYVPRLREELTTSALDKIKWLQIVKREGSKEKATRLWLDGKVPADVVLPPKICADRIIKRKLKLAQKIVKKGKTKIVLENISHQENMQAVIERLTGRNSEDYLHGKPIMPLEKLTFKFDSAAPEKVTMLFRGIGIDVTERFWKVLTLKKEGSEIV